MKIEPLHPKVISFFADIQMYVNGIALGPAALQTG